MTEKNQIKTTALNTSGSIRSVFIQIAKKNNETPTGNDWFAFVEQRKIEAER